MIDICREYIKSLMNDIYYSEIGNINKASKLISNVVHNNGAVYFFGQGHSVWVGRDVLNCYDLPIKVMEEENISTSELLNKNNINQNDIVVITSNSGINSYVIDLAIELKKRCIKLIVINSNKHTLKVESRHISKTKLYQYGDVVIDNCCVYGDAAIKDEDNYIGSFSSIANNAIVHTILNMVTKESR